MRIRPAALVLALGLLAACAEQPTTSAVGDGTSPPSETGPIAPLPSADTSVSLSARATGRGATVVAAASDFGTILFDDTGQAVYLFDLEATSKPRCYGSCARAWPPVLTTGPPHAGKRVRVSLLGTTLRRDGKRQVTYDGHPLYYYAHEGKREVECHDVFLNGGTWYAVRPDGTRA